MATKIGNSGFEYTTHNNSSKRQKGLNCTIKDTKTDKILTTLVGKGTFWGRKGSTSPGSTPSKKFLGYDERWYYVEVSGGNTVNWGTITSSGAVIKSDRSMLRHINFYPLYIKTAPIMIPGEPIKTKEPVKPAVKPQITTISPKPEIKPEVKEISWWKKIINWIIKILNR